MCKRGGRFLLKGSIVVGDYGACLSFIKQLRLTTGGVSRELNVCNVDILEGNKDKQTILPS